MVEQSPSAEIWRVNVTSINDGAQILTSVGIDSYRDFQKSRFFCGNSIIEYDFSLPEPRSGLDEK